MSSHYSVFIVLADNIVWYNSFCLVSWINLGQFLMLVEARPDIYCLKLQRTMSQVRQNQQTLDKIGKQINENVHLFIKLLNIIMLDSYFIYMVYITLTYTYTYILYDSYINLQTHNIKRIYLPPNYSTLVFILNSWRKIMVDLACTVHIKFIVEQKLIKAQWRCKKLSHTF